MIIASNLPEQPTSYDFDLRFKIKRTKRFIESMMYLIKKLFML